MAAAAQSPTATATNNPLASAVQRILPAVAASAAPQSAVDIFTPERKAANNTTMADQTAATSSAEQKAWQDSIAKIESGGRYDLVGPTTNGNTALGKYQVMSNNVGPWTKEVLGTAMTPQQFLRSPQAQDAVFNAKFGGYVQQYGLEGAAQAWFGGPGSVGKGDRKDKLGTSVSSYGQRFVAGLGKSSASPVDRVMQGGSPSDVASSATQQPAGAVSQPDPSQVATVSDPSQQSPEGVYVDTSRDIPLPEAQLPQVGPAVSKAAAAAPSIAKQLIQRVMQADPKAAERLQALKNKTRYQA